LSAQLEKEVEIGPWLSGTLAMPQKSKNLYLLIIHPGSGPTDRNGNQANTQNNSLKFLSDSLVSKGYTCFRLDKRIIKMIKENAINEKELLFDTLVQDLRQVVSYFHQNYNFSKIILVGHSEGSLISMMASFDNLWVSAFISLCGPGRPADEVLSEQISISAPFIKDTSNVILAKLKKGIQVDTLMPLLKTIFRPSVQPYLISWMKYNPSHELSKLNIPILILNGDNDLQVDVKEAELLRQSNPSAKKIVIEGMNHVLKICDRAKQANLATYSNPALPVSSNLITSIDKFLKNL
jgi:pimeloyl-ACP methyl ester carboxylesterase